jgi:hypothetical protein
MIARTTHQPRRVLAFCAMFFALSAAACGGGADHPAGGYQYDESAETDETNEVETEEPVKTDGGAPTGTCIEGATQECKITLPSQGSVENCVTGFQFCEQGTWTECDPDPM